MADLTKLSRRDLDDAIADLERRLWRLETEREEAARELNQLRAEDRRRLWRPPAESDAAPR